MSNKTKHKNDEKMDEALREAGTPEFQIEATREAFKSAANITQGDKLFLRNQLDMTFSESEDFLFAIALWKRRGGGMTEWNFVMAMTDDDLLKELGIPDEDPNAEEGKPSE